MIYGAQDLATEERNAWQRGDYALAAALGAQMDAEAAAEESQTEQEKAADEAATAASKRNDCLAEAHTALDDLYAMVEDAARVSARDKILAAVLAIGETLKGAA